jgi:IS30 family transposase
MPRGYNQVTQEERFHIYALKSIGISIRGIAQRLNRAHSTIIKKIERNIGKRGYRPKQAREKATVRKKKATRRTKMALAFIALIEERLALEWSPEEKDLPHPVKTITYDNGKEFSAHQEIAKVLNAKC